MGVTIDLLDEMVSEYWDLRTNGVIGEDIQINDSRCPFGNSQQKKEYLKDLINYFLFDGSAICSFML